VVVHAQVLGKTVGIALLKSGRDPIHNFSTPIVESEIMDRCCQTTTCWS